ncbi:hypothetical protein BC831DRAFT_459190 [Entophlyctis helioformis]|nr:hypothetical protein BC831DRAFT_459190 [Entophlyctis helioformis]
MQAIPRWRLWLTQIDRVLLAGSCMVPQPSPQPYIAMTHSQSFRSYNQRDFPGMQKSPPLMQHFFRQGVRISVRSKTPPRKTL